MFMFQGLVPEKAVYPHLVPLNDDLFIARKRSPPKKKVRWHWRPNQPPACNSSFHGVKQPQQSAPGTEGKHPPRSPSPISGA